jgi:hypothetical protein
MPSASNVVIRIDLQSGVTIGAGNSPADAENGALSTNGPITRPQRPLIDEVFCKLLTAIYGGKKTIDLKTINGTAIVRDDSFPVPCIDHHVASAIKAAPAGPEAAALEMIRSIVARIPPPKKAKRPKQPRSSGKRSPRKKTPL